MKLSREVSHRMAAGLEQLRLWLTQALNYTQKRKCACCNRELVLA
jgi:hypothetical protein